MADELESMLGLLEGEGPSEEFVARLRGELLAEAADGAMFPGADPTDDGRSGTDPDTGGGRWWIAAAAVVAAILVGVLLLIGREDPSEVDIIDVPDPTTTVEATTTTTSTPEDEEQTAPAAEPQLLLDDNQLLSSGAYRTETIGTPIVFEMDDRLYVRVNSRGAFVLAHVNGGGPDDRDLSFFRLTDLSDPARPDLDDIGAVDGWPADDFTGWLDGLHDGVEVANVEATTVSGLAAISADLTLPEGECTTGRDRCMALGTNREIFTKDLYAGSQHRVWVVEQADEDPLAIVASIVRPFGMDGAWFDTAQAIVDSLDLGEVGPNPMAPVASEASAVELPFLGGIRVKLPPEAFVIDDPAGFGRIVPGEVSGDTELLTNPHGLDRVELTSAVEVVEAIAATGAQVDEFGSAEVAGVPAVVIDIADAKGTGELRLPAMRASADAERPWFVPPIGRMWLIEHPERGLLVVTAEAWNATNISFPIALAQTEALLDSLQFVELDAEGAAG